MHQNAGGARTVLAGYPSVSAVAMGGSWLYGRERDRGLTALNDNDNDDGNYATSARPPRQRL